MFGLVKRAKEVLHVYAVLRAIFTFELQKGAIETQQKQASG